MTKTIGTCDLNLEHARDTDNVVEEADEEDESRPLVDKQKYRNKSNYSNEERTGPMGKSPRDVGSRLKGGVDGAEQTPSGEPEHPELPCHSDNPLAPYFCPLVFFILAVTILLALITGCKTEQQRVAVVE